MQHLHNTQTHTVAISQEERAFFVAFGERLAALRKAQGLTQVQLAGLLEVSQQAVTAYENGQRRVPISMLPLLADTLSVTIEDLIGVSTRRSASKRGPQPKIALQLQRIEALPKAKQRAISQVLDSVIAAHQ
jgi:transcriptional regulator with XRE-family HTH domain